MRKILLVLLCLGFIAAFEQVSEAAPRRETIEITTYYPAPYGVYYELGTHHMKYEPMDKTDGEVGSSGTSRTCTSYGDLGQSYYFEGDSSASSDPIDSGLRICNRVWNGSSWDYGWTYAGGGTPELSIVQNDLDPTQLILNPDIAEYSLPVELALDKNLTITKSTVISMGGICDGFLDMSDPTAPVCIETEISMADKKLGIGTDSPSAPLAIKATLAAATTSPHNRAIHVNDESLILTYRLRLPSGRTELRTAIPMNNPGNYKCQVSSSAIRYHQGAAIDTDDFLWTYRNLSDNQWYIYFKKNDADMTGLSFKPLVDVVCYHTGIVTPRYLEYSGTGWFSPTGPGSALNDYTSP